MLFQDWFLLWDNTPVHTSATVQKYLAEKGIKTLRHPPYSPDLAPADLFIFPRVKSKLAGLLMNQESFQKSWKGGHPYHPQGQLCRRLLAVDGAK